MFSGNFLANKKIKCGTAKTLLITEFFEKKENATFLVEKIIRPIIFRVIEIDKPKGLRDYFQQFKWYSEKKCKL